MANLGRRGWFGEMIMDSGKLEISHDSDALEYSLRVSLRAKRMQLKVTSWGKIEVVVPTRADITRVAPFVRKHRKWLERTLANVRAMRDAQPALGSLVPGLVHLAALSEEWQVSYAPSARTRVRADIAADGRRLLQIETVEGVAAHIALQGWVHDRARQCLIPWLQEVSGECRLPFARATVRAQKTRWGSCTTQGHISLNRHLLFLPPRLARYVLIHELCHTVHMNHSRRYWALVQRHEPDYAACEAELRRAARYIPLWACRE